ncbi:hypothetical protein BGX28_000463 [Mortierella sp. GBA30]|nr:hypothetical protein BGX28_000463 [Mortierella sp. GBA30]
MFDIPELDEMVCLQLHRRTLARCARVNKKWNRVVTPYVWHDLSDSRLISEEKAFCKMVLHDYLEEQERQQQPPKEDPGLKQPPQTRSSPPLSLLAKYGACIRLIPKDPSCLLANLTRGQSYLSREQAIDPAPQDLFRHLLKHCTALEVRQLCLRGALLKSNHLIKTVADFILPHARRLIIRSGPVESWRLKYLLARCSSKLEELTLDTAVTGPEDGKVNEEEPKEEEVLNIGAQPRYLRLSFRGDASESKAFWSWLWRRSIYVERLEVLSTDDIVHSLAEGMLSMSNLDRIELGSETFSHKDENGYDAYCMDLEDEHVATMLSSCRKGWNVVQVRSSASFGDAAWKSLVNHFFTLEEMVVLGGVSFGGNELRRILSSCPNLHTLVTIDDGTYLNSDNMCVEMYAKTFVDLDHATGALNPWACERSLKVLKVRVTNVSDDSNRYCSAIQSQVYKRLARLINLETLWLGHDPRIATERRPDVSVQQQDNCLQMSLESGLDMLQGLTALQELSVSNMDTLIEWKELQWMTQHWPRLRIIMGMDEKDRDKVAAQWLQDHPSEIKLRAEWLKDDRD